MSGERWLVPGVTVLMVAVGLFAWTVLLRAPLRVDPSPLAALEIEVPGWRTAPVPLDETVESMLRADFNLQRAFVPAVGPRVWLYIGYYGTTRGGHPEHTPWACYGAQGWQLEETRRITLDPELGLRANEFVVSQHGRRRLVHFWYRSHRRSGMLGQADVVLDHTLGRLTTGRADGALVRLSTPLLGDDLADARARLASFERRVEQELALHWPRESRDG